MNEREGIADTTWILATSPQVDRELIPALGEDGLADKVNEVVVLSTPAHGSQAALVRTLKGDPAEVLEVNFGHEGERYFVQMRHNPTWTTWWPTSCMWTRPACAG